MKFAALLTAILSGLCAEAMAAPISNIRTVPPAFEYTAIEPDLEFNSELVDQALQDGDQPELVPTSLPMNGEIGEEELSTADSEPSESLRVPEPPPVTTIAIGLCLLGFLALWRQNHKERRRALRRTVQLRAIIIAER